MKLLLKLSPYLYFICTTFLINACSPIYYVPNSQNVPLFTEKGEGRIAGSFTASEYTTGINLSGAYSFSNHFGFTGNIFLVGEADNGLIPNRKTNKGHLVDAGLVYFLPFGSRFVFESTAGFGGGAATNQDDYGYSKVKFRNYYVQPSIGITGKHFDLALSTKYSILSYHNLGSSASQTGEYPLDKPYFLFEPAITMRFGWEHVKIQTQYVYSFNISNVQLGQDFINFNFGLYFMLTDKYSR